MADFSISCDQMSFVPKNVKFEVPERFHFMKTLYAFYENALCV